jgi:REP element-mobilizing transposase RayT
MIEHKGWHSRGYLPHFDSSETVQFITFRLADSLPRHLIEALRAEDDAVALLDRELDAGFGACWLRKPEIADMVQEALLHFDADRYRLLAWCIMPNHVHVVLEMLDHHSLSAIVKSWKSFTSRRANAHLGRAGSFWEADYFDRYMRNEKHLLQTIEYVEHNPVKAGLVDVPTAWRWSSAYEARAFRSAHES